MDLNPKYRYANKQTSGATLADCGLLAAAKYVFDQKAKREHSRALKRARDARYRERKRETAKTYNEAFDNNSQ